MRVISGTAGGKTLQAVPGSTTRPILDRVKKPLFDILRPRIQGIVVLDLFAGAGSVGIEALSEGASFCTFNDMERKAVTTIQKNLEHTGFTKQAEVFNYDAFQFLRKAKKTYDLIYIAPPQYKGMWAEAVRSLAERHHLLSETGLIIVQIDPKEYEQIETSTFREIDQRKYGKTLLIFYSKTQTV